MKRWAILGRNEVAIAMTVQMPEKLELSPLREVFFEIQFEPAIPRAGDILPGLFYSKMKAEYGEVTTLPLAGVPRKIRQQNPEFHYQASHRLSGGSSSILIGDRVVSLTTVEYPGWTIFKSKLLSLLGILKETEQAKAIRRFSFKYINLIESPATDRQIAMLNIGVAFRGSPPGERGFLFRTEFDEDGCTTIVQIATRAVVKALTSKSEMFGLLLDIDTIRFDPGNDFLSKPDTIVEEAHGAAKKAFFSLLTPSTLEKLKPVWNS